jgi:hypothetical protein
LLVLLFDPEDGGNMFLQNVGLLSPDYTALYPRSQNSSVTTMRISNTTPLHYSTEKREERELMVTHYNLG